MGLLKILFAPIRFILKLLLPKPKKQKPEAAQDLENPTADRSRPIPVVFGTVMVKGLNNLWFGDKQIRTHNVKG